jgi:hypothetical protein
LEVVPEKEKTTLGMVVCFLCRIWSGLHLLLLGTNASEADVEDRLHVGKLRHTINEFVSIAEVVITWMSETLVPKHTLGLHSDAGDIRVGWDVLMERQAVKSWVNTG